MNFFAPTDIRFDENALEQLGQILNDLHCNRIFVIFGKQSAFKNGLKDRIEKILQLYKLEYKLAFGVEPEPYSNTVDRVYNETIDFFPDVVIGIGGGSVLDVAKFVAVLIPNGGKCAEYEYNSQIKNRPIKLIAIPTTAGSGSEVTPYSVINNSATERKFTVKSPFMFPTVALVDPVLTFTLNKETTLSTGLDALIHNCEAFLSTERNFIVEPIIMKGLETITSNLPLALENPNAALYRKNMCVGSLIGGIGISTLRTGLIHTCSVALNPYIPLPHGLLNAIIAIHVLEFNVGAYEGRLARMVNVMFNHEIKSDTASIETIREFFDRIGVPRGLKKFGIHNINVKSIVERINQDHGFRGINPKSFSDEDLAMLIKNIFSQ